MIKVFFFCIVMILLTGSCSKEDLMDPVAIEDINLTLVSEGTYIGEYTDQKSEGFSKVQVDVFQHRIGNLKILGRKCSPVGKKGEYVVNNILKKQSLKVDVVSGATITSTIILKATEIALKKGIPND